MTSDDGHVVSWEANQVRKTAEDNFRAAHRSIVARGRAAGTGTHTPSFYAGGRLPATAFRVGDLGMGSRVRCL